MDFSLNNQIQRAAEVIRAADALLIGAGAGMGVDSGLPDFRGTDGFWNAYPPYAKLKLDFVSLANPRWFDSAPELAWGFYGHRMMLYRATQPHRGFDVLRSWMGMPRLGSFVFTSNVDAHFSRAGFSHERIVEIHGSLDWLQCTRSCGVGLFSSNACHVRVDEETLHAIPPLPSCPECGSLARPNVLMFGDFDWVDARTRSQIRRLETWLASLGGANLAIIECGAGVAVPSVRRFCEEAVRGGRGRLIRINTRECDVPAGQIALPLPALDALQRIEQALVSSQPRAFG
jgi:NAD-dependent SIR2 family protein deacetylase